MDERDRQRLDEFAATQEPFRHNAIKIIIKMLKWCNQTPGSRDLVNEILHSIFFLGKILKFEPEKIISDEDIRNRLKERYPGPFLYYKSQVPKRSPFSCVLDMIVLRRGRDNVDQIKHSLQKLVMSLKEGFLVSSTICVTSCQKTNKTYYGVSMSTTGANPGKIMIAASCCSHVWDDYVAGAVMTYYPERANQSPKLHEKKSYFDGTFKLPDNVTCKAFNIKNDEYLPPCRSCKNLFGLATGGEKEWPYGHCAEVESVRNLLKNEAEVKSNARPTSPTYTEENWNEAKNSVENVLRQVLKMVGLEWSSEALQFYNPQEQY